MLVIIDIRPGLKDLRPDNLIGLSAYRLIGSAAEIIFASDVFGAL